MEINFKKPSLTMEYYSILLDDNISYRGRNDVSKVTDKINYYIDKIDNYKTICKDEVDDKQFYSLLTQIAKINLNKEDYINILELMNNKNYNRISKIKTSMIANRKMATRVEYEAILSDRIKKDNNYIYTVRNISELTESNDLVLLREKLVPLIDIDSKKLEKYFKFNTLNFNDFLNPDDEKNSYLIKYIRSMINKDDIKKELKNYILELNTEINRIISREYIINNSKIISNDINSELINKGITLKFRKKIYED